MKGMEFSPFLGYIMGMGMAIYHDWLYDNRDAWQKTISDPRWTYDMPISRFMAIYSEYRGSPTGASTHSSSALAMAYAPLPVSAPMIATAAVAPVPAPAAASSSSGKGASGGPGQILSQNEIDSLLNQLTI